MDLPEDILGISGFINALVPKREPAYIATPLPFDIFLDHIIPCLHVEDVIALRRVNKYFYCLTFEPLTWRRYVQTINHPLAPIRPSFNFSTRAMAHEYQTLVTRAISSEDNWRKKEPVLKRHLVIPSSHQVLDMTLLPGGKYLVASVRNAYQFFIELYHLDHRDGPHLLARVETPARAYKLKARYMIHKGVPVIMIVHVYSTFKENQRTNQDPSEYANTGNIDPPAILIHDLACLRVDLRPLEHFAGDHRHPDSKDNIKHKLWSSNMPSRPFQVTLLHALEHPIEPTLFSRAGVPFVSLYQPTGDNRPFGTIILINLVTHTQCALVCHPNVNTHGNLAHGSREEIRAIRALPEQNQMLIIRTITHRPYSLPPAEHYLELYDMPPLDSDAVTVVPAREWRDFRVGERKDYPIDTFRITDFEVPTTNGQTEFVLKGASQPLPPISIFAETREPKGSVIDHHVLWPCRVDSPAKGQCQFRYSLHDLVVQTKHTSHPLRVRLFPGAYRCLLLASDLDDRSDTPHMVKLRRYINPEFQHDNYELERVERKSDAEKKAIPKMPNNVYGTLKLNAEVQEFYRVHGVAALAWDESIARVCLAPGPAPGTKHAPETGHEITILDFSDDHKLDRKIAEGVPICHEPIDDITPVSIVQKRVEAVLKRGDDVDVVMLDSARSNYYHNYNDYGEESDFGDSTTLVGSGDWDSDMDSVMTDP
ncbi:hypothetical protein DXG01_006794 [Tephrocybe rancida]|nr:hypothetical protein DXG01_006794 [Tephrocybe rancida]